MLAAPRKSAAPLISRRPGAGVDQDLLDRVQRLWMKSESVRSGGGSPRQVCRLAPPRSASTSTTRRPMRASCQPIDAARIDLPMPPLPPPIDQIWRRVRWRRLPLADFGHAQGHFTLSASEVSNLRAGVDFFQMLFRT